MITPSFGLTATERILPKLALDFTTASLDPRITFTRALNTATRVNSSGYIESVNADTPRFDYDPITLACKGLLIEESRTNILLNSADLSAVTWQPDGVSLTPNAIVSPDGTQNAAIVQTLSSASTGQIYALNSSLSVTPSTNYTVSFYAKNIDASYVTYGVLQVSPSPAWIVDIADPANNYVGQLSTSEWRRITFTFNSGSATSINLYVSSQVPTNERLSPWGAQLEVGAFPTSYIPTTTTSLTRNADVATMTGTNFSSWFNQTEGAIYTESSALSLSNLGGIFAIGDPAQGFGSGEMMYSTYNNSDFGKINYVVVDGGVIVVNITANASQTANTVTRAVSSYKLDSFASSVSAVIPATDTSGTVPTPTDCSIGSLVSGWSGATQYLNGHIAKFFYYPQRLLDSEVQAFSK